MVFESFRKSDLHYFSAKDRRSFMNSTLPAIDVTMWLGRYDAMRPMHAVQDRNQSEALGVVAFYSLTLTAQFFAMQIVAMKGERKRVPVRTMPAGTTIANLAERKAGRSHLGVAAAGQNGRRRPRHTGYAFQARRIEFTVFLRCSVTCGFLAQVTHTRLRN